MHDSTCCLRCGRALRSARSIAKGVGRHCESKIRQASIAAATVAPTHGYKPAQVDRAAELLEQGGLIPTSRPGGYSAVSGDGTVTYLVTVNTCTCHAGQNGRHCYHRLAVAILDSTRKAA